MHGDRGGGAFWPPGSSPRPHQGGSLHILKRLNSQQVTGAPTQTASDPLYGDLDSSSFSCGAAQKSEGTLCTVNKTVSPVVEKVNSSDLLLPCPYSRLASQEAISDCSAQASRSDIKGVKSVSNNSTGLVATEESFSVLCCKSCQTSEKPVHDPFSSSPFSDFFVLKK